MRRLYLTLMVLMSVGCAGVHKGRGIYVRTKNTAPLESSRSLNGIAGSMADRLKIAAAAASVVGQRRVVANGVPYRADCSGTVRGIYALAGLSLGGKARFVGENDTAILHRYAFYEGALHGETPLPGDMIFFHDTLDPPGAKSGDVRFTHIGVVESALPDGTVIFIHHLQGKIIRSRMNLHDPSVKFDADDNVALNSALRRQNGKRPSLTAAQLFAGFGRLSL